MTRIAILIAEGLARAKRTRSDNAGLYDLEVVGLEAALKDIGIELVEIEWRSASDADWRDLDAALPLAAWDYQDYAPALLARLSDLTAKGVQVWNAPGLIKWNIQKTYLKELANLGAPVIPTLWHETMMPADLTEAFRVLETDDLVMKRQIGAGAHGQRRWRKDDSAPGDGPIADRPVMVQPFLPSIVEEGEYSFLFIEGELSHALIKRAAKGDYRIQNRYGGTKEAIKPTEKDLAVAQNVLKTLPAELGADPLYARVDLARGADGGLRLMELELIEPYLYPEEGPEALTMLAAAIARRLRSKTA